ncbi:M1 family metallopeptidase [Actinoplanes sp. URMC 104]|uniref:M1 family metallopeptidase n=1 Tax=Actinoplanes sp. URMC 104 TaxID=3423409 RepID=UPI003F192ED8
MHRAPAVVALTAIILVAACDDAAPASPPSPASAGPSPTATVDYAAWQTGASTPVADRLYPRHGNPALDVLHYDLRLNWQAQQKILEGTATLRIRPTTDAGRIDLDFKPYALSRVTLDGRPVPGARVAGEKLIVPAPVARDRPVTLVVAYRGRPATTPMPSHRNDVEPLGLTITEEGGLWTMQEPYGAYTWYPANDHPSDKALYDIAVTVPTGWSAIAAGTPAGQTGSTFRYRSTDPMASYLQTLAVGRYTKLTARGPRGVPLTYWYRPGDDKFVPSLRKSPAFLTFLEKRFGPYPFPSGGAVMVDSESAMETQQMVTMGGARRTFERQGFEEDLLHEYAHHWFGDSVTPTSWDDLWLSEGWATYAQLLYSQSVLGFGDRELEDYLRRSDAELRTRLGPPARPKAANFAESNVYLCPAAMLKELHDALGDAGFFALGRAWVQTHRNSQQTRASFTAFVNKQTGRDFTELIDSWLDAARTPA